MADLFGLTGADDTGAESTVTFEDITTLIEGLTNVINQMNSARAAQESSQQSAATTASNIRKTNAEIKIDAARQALAALAEKFKQEMGVEELNLKREDQRMKQAGAQEELMTSGMKRFQSSTLFEQAQQDRRKKQEWSKALVKGIAEGLAHRTGQSLLQGQQQQNVNQQMLPSIAGGVQ